jgi:hypothetical protein
MKAGRWKDRGFIQVFGIENDVGRFIAGKDDWCRFLRHGDKVESIWWNPVAGAVLGAVL